MQNEELGRCTPCLRPAAAPRVTCLPDVALRLGMVMKSFTHVACVSRLLGVTSVKDRVSWFLSNPLLILRFSGINGLT